MTNVVNMEDKQQVRAVEKARQYFRKKGKKCSVASRIDQADGFNDGFYFRDKGRSYRVLAVVNTAKMRNSKDTFTMTDAERNWLKRPSDRVFLVQEHEDGTEKHFEVYKDDIELNDHANTDADAKFKVYRAKILYPAEV